jgi:hypothetical protein
MAMHHVFGAPDPQRRYTPVHSAYALLLNAQGCLALTTGSLPGTALPAPEQAEQRLQAYLQQDYTLDVRILWHLATTESYSQPAAARLEHSAFYLAELEEPAGTAEQLQWLAPPAALAQLPDGPQRWAIERFSPYLTP